MAASSPASTRTDRPRERPITPRTLVTVSVVWLSVGQVLGPHSGDVMP